MKCKLLMATKKRESLEDIVNRWLAENPNLEIKFVTMGGGYTYTPPIIIFYEE